MEEKRVFFHLRMPSLAEPFKDEVLPGMRSCSRCLDARRASAVARLEAITARECPA